MKRNFLKLWAFATILGSFSLTSCSDDDSKGPNEPQVTEDRWITVAGAVMGTAADATPGDGNGGTLIYSVTKEDAKDPSKSIDVFENGFIVPSARTARLQSSEDGFTFFNIAYGGGNGGEFSKYLVNGGNNFSQTGSVVSIASYASTSPRWVKLFDGDRTGVAVNVSSPTVVAPEGVYQHTRGNATVLSLDMVNAAISAVKTYEIPLSAAEEAIGHHIFRLDAPVLNKAANKLIIGTWMRKTNPETGANESSYERLGSKSVVVDYPSLENPVVITSIVGFGDTSGYRSFNSFVGDDGNIYQATQRDTNGSHILRINQNNQYDNSYVFNLDAALGVTGSYIENWRYAGNGKAIVAYTHDNAAVSSASGQSQGFLALIDLNAKTAQQIALPYHVDAYFFQYQGFVVDGFDIYVTYAPVGQNGNIYIINSITGVVTEGAKLINKQGNHFIGAF